MSTQWETDLTYDLLVRGYHALLYYHALFNPAPSLKVELVAKDFVKNMSKQAFIATF